MTAKAAVHTKGRCLRRRPLVWTVTVMQDRKCYY